MANTVVFVPKPEMVPMAEKLAPQYKLDFLYIKAITAPESEEVAAAAIAAGADLIIARGLAAINIKKAVTVPVVEISLTVQELGQLVLRVRRELGLERPRIGLVGFKNMFCDITAFDTLYEVEMTKYFVERFEQLDAYTRQAQADRMDAIIGGDEVCRVAQLINHPAYFITSGEESIADAFRVAEKVSYAIDQEKKNTTLLRTLLDHSFNGIIKIDVNGDIEYANHVVEKFFGIQEDAMQGRPLSILLPAVSGAMLDQVLKQGDEIYATAINTKKAILVTSIAPILFNQQVQGAIVSFQESRKLIEMEAELRREMYQAGFAAKFTFDDLVWLSAGASETAALAKSYAATRAPVLILGDDSGERDMLAQSIHNGGPWRGRPFVSCSCESMPPNAVGNWLFGCEQPGATPYAPKGLVDMAEGGTLFLDRVSALDEYAQFRLLRVLTSKTVTRSGDTRQQPVSLRLIAADGPDLLDMVRQGLFRQDLYYALSTLPLSLTPLRQRPEDVMGWIGRYISEFEKTYDRFIHLTANANKVLDGFDWEGGLPQIRSLCERIVALAPRRTADESTVRRLLQHAAPPVSLEDKSHGDLPAAEGQMDKRIVDLLKKYRNNRRLVAHDLGISTTTLWRYMKRYDIQGRLGGY